MPLTADRNTPSMDGELISVPVATATTIYAGSIVVANASGYAAPGSTATTLQYLGRAEETVVNAGANGAKSIQVRRKQAFKWGNYASDAIVQADLGKTAYIFDDAQVAKTSGGSTRSIAGKIIQLDSDGVWIE